MNSRRCLSEAAEPLFPVRWFENHAALESQDQRRRYATVFSIGVQRDEVGRWQARSRCVLETHSFSNGDVRLRFYPFLIHETAKNQAVLARRTLDFDSVK